MMEFVSSEPGSRDLGGTLVDIPPRAKEVYPRGESAPAVESSKSPCSAPAVVMIPPSSGSAASQLSCPLNSSEATDDLGTPPRVPSRSSVWDGINWSKSASMGSKNRSTISCSSSSDEESRCSSVDLEEDHQSMMQAEVVATVALNQHRAAVISTQRNLFVPPHQRRRGGSVETVPVVPQQVEGNRVIETFSEEEGNDRITSRSPLGVRSTAVLTARSRRSLLLLFLIAVYTTFGLTSPNLPLAEHVDFQDTVASAPVEVIKAQATAELVSDLPNSQLRAATPRKAVGINLSFARRNNRQSLTYRRKEMSDFYQQQALRDESLYYSWYVNCTALVAVALWAWRERSIAASEAPRRASLLN
jgi:hypothetical protein